MSASMPPEQELEPVAEAATASRPAWAAYQDATWQTGAFRGLAIGLLSASLIVAPVAVVRAIVGWQLGYAFPLALFVSLMAVFTTTLGWDAPNGVTGGASLSGSANSWRSCSSRA